MREMTQREKEIFNDLMDLYEFEVYTNEQDKFQVNDLQGACLGDICDDIFNDEWEILERMETYHLDYIINGLENTFNLSFDTFEEWVELLEREDLEELKYTEEILKLLTKGAE
jgi:hypothetical protein